MSPLVSLLNNKRKIYYKKFITHARKRPVTTFVGLLLILLGLIILSNFISRPKTSTLEQGLVVKEVEVYTIGTSPKITVQAKVEKSGVVKVVALGSGVVQSISVLPGQEVGRGQNLVSMSTNYQGGNAFSVQRQLAQVAYKNVLDTYQTNKDLINKQKELAEKSDKNADELRRISGESLEASRSLINLNNDILSTLEGEQAELEATNVGGANDASILQTKQLRAQLKAGNNQLESGLKSSEYLGKEDNPPAQISDISKDIALGQLEIQRKALDLNREVSRLSVILSQINEGLMFPSAPFYGVIDRVYVRIGQAVTPGTPLVQISGNNQSLIAVALLSGELAQGISSAGISTIHIGGSSFDLAPFYVSKDATDGQLYTVEFSIPEEHSSTVTDKEYLTVEIPIDFPKTGGTIPFVPIDAVFQTQDQAFLFVAKNGKALSKKVNLGQVVGRFVEIKSGLSTSDQVILQRNVIQGDPVKIVNK